MSFHEARRGMIWFRSENARTPSLFHRASLTVSQMEHLQTPGNARQEKRLRKALALTMTEIEQVRKNGGNYMPATHRLGLFSKRR